MIPSLASATPQSATSRSKHYVRRARRPAAPGRRRHVAEELRRDADATRCGPATRSATPTRSSSSTSSSSQGKPVFGICRGHQLINVALGGTLYQDIATQRPGARRTATAKVRPATSTTCAFLPDTWLSRALSQASTPRINTHPPPGDQGPRRGPRRRGAMSEPDGIVEAVRWEGHSFVVGVQWHPEFMDPEGPGALDSRAAAARLPRRARRAGKTAGCESAPLEADPQPRDRRRRRRPSPPTTPKSVTAKYERARAAQPAWAATPLEQRLDAIARFRALVVAERETLAADAHHRGRQADRAGAQRAEGRAAAHRLLPRRDRARAAPTRRCPREGRRWRSASRHEPLGVVANISAWNYP